ncbi:MAG: glycosyl hydrolase family 25 [Ruminococcus sp.]|nr:glycosyl hydrolase family 25 [Ruminococcus sp.]
MKYRKTAFAAVGAVMTAACVGVSALISPLRVSSARYPVFGVDVSHYQGDIDWSVLEEQGVRFAFIKATEGSGHVDESVRDNIELSAETSIKRSCYHFFSFDSPGSTQADNFISAVGRDEIDMPPVVDIEYYADKSSNKPSQAEAKEILTPLLEKLEAHYGTKPIIYTTIPVYLRYIRESYGDYPLWIRCTYIEPECMDWVFWQYDDSQKLMGYSGEEECIDLNVFNGTEAEFAAMFP